MASESLEQVGATLRPESVVWYERLNWIAIALGLAYVAAGPAALAKYYDRYSIGYPMMIGILVGGQLIWIWLVARKRQNWARWISLIVTLLGLPNAISDIEEPFWFTPVASSFYYSSFAISTVSVMLLFRSDARKWFSRERFVSVA